MSVAGRSRESASMHIGDAIDSPRRVAEWNRVLFELLLPLGKDSESVVLACDDEIVRAAGLAMGIPPQLAVEDLINALKRTLKIDSINGVRNLMVLGHSFQRAARPRPAPLFLSALCLFVLAASRMAPGEDISTHSYYPRLRDLLSLPSWAGEIPGFGYVPTLFTYLAEWLDADQQGRRGRLFVPNPCRPPFVGACVAQTIFRERDRQVLSEFFSDRLTGSLDGLDVLLLLRRWPGRHRLTRHARGVVHDGAMESQVRSAIETAIRSWDGSVLLGDGRRVWQARMRLAPRPLGLYLAASNLAPIDFKIGRFAATMVPSREVKVPWEILDLVRAFGMVLGQSQSGESIRAPVVGETLLFEAEEHGLWRVRGASQNRVWALTRDLTLQSQLAAWKLPAEGLPRQWQVFREVPVDNLPDALREIHSEKRMPLAIAAGLPVERNLYIVGGPPSLIAGELEPGEILTIEVNSKVYTTIASGQTIPLPGGEAGTYRVNAGHGLFTATYHMTTKGHGHDEYGGLSFHQGERHSVRAGARPTQAGSLVAVCGAKALPRRDVVLPIVRTPTADVITLTQDGRASVHKKPPPSDWMAVSGLSSGSRWEIPGDGVVWLLCPGDHEVTLWAPQAIEHIHPASARHVRGLGKYPRLRVRRGLQIEAEPEWLKLFALAQEVHR